MLERSACFDVMFAFHIRHVRAKSRVRQFPLLIQRRRRTTGNHSSAVRKRVSAGVVIKPVLADEPPQREQRRRADQAGNAFADGRSEEHTSELQSRQYLVCRLLLEKKKNK